MFVPLKYDIGGRIADPDRAREIMSEMFADVQDDHLLMRNWNLSHLVRQASVLRGTFPGDLVLKSPKVIRLGGNEWHWERSVFLYPWLGVLSVDYRLWTAESDIDAVALYRDLVRWKDNDYYLYLEQAFRERSGANGQRPAGHPVARRIPWSGRRDEEVPARLRGEVEARRGELRDLHGHKVIELRRRLLAAGVVEQRPSSYYFHEYRFCFVDHGGVLGRRAVSQLLLLTEEPQPTGRLGERLVVSGIEVESTGRSTVIRRRRGRRYAGATDETVAEALATFGLVHANWYVCRVWLDVYDGIDGRKSRQSLRAAQLALARDLTDAENAPHMVKDPSLLRMVRYFGGAFELPQYVESARQRGHVLEEYARRDAESRTSRRLEFLFSVAAAGGLASLVPALAEAGFHPGVVAWTCLVLVSVWGITAINLSAGRHRGRPQGQDD